MNIKKLLAITVMALAVFTACEKEDVIEPSIKNIRLEGLWNNSYLEGQILHLESIYLTVDWDNGDQNKYGFADFSEKGFDVIPNNGAKVSLENDSVIVMSKELGLRTGMPIEVIANIVTDYDGNNYNVIKMYDQYWLAQNMKTTHYSNGKPIPHVIDLNNNGSTNDEWYNLKSNASAYCFYDDDKESIYGALYTWSAAMGVGVVETNQGVCPDGFRVAKEGDWNKLYNEIVNDYRISGRWAKHLKAKEGWYNGGNGTDSLGFNALPGGMRDYWSGAFERVGQYSYWWTGTEGRGEGAYSQIFAYNDDFSIAGGGLDGADKNYGFSVRCVQDTE